MRVKDDPDYHKKYYEENKEAILAKNREWRKQNRDKVRAQKKAYYELPENKAKKKAKSVREYLENRDKILARTQLRRAGSLRYMNEVALEYGCQNKDCKWEGEFKPYQLCFHHLDPATKETEVSKMCSWSLDKIKAEINKCVVLCLNCHPLVHKGDILVNESMLCKEQT